MDISSLISSISVNPINTKIIISLLFFLVLLALSALISGSEVAIFSLDYNFLEKTKNTKNTNEKILKKLLENPNKTLATILIANNFVNIGIVIISTYISSNLFDFQGNYTLKFVIETIVITFLILLFGEIIPKVYAKKYYLPFAKFMAKPINILSRIFSPLSAFLMTSTQIFDKIQTTEEISLNELNQAIELAEENMDDAKTMAKSVINIHNTEVREIMTSRVDTFTLECSEDFKTIKQKIAEKNFSRIPVYEKNLDNIKGVLYIKDLIKNLKQEEFQWCEIIKAPYFVPENKKIDDLLKEFRKNKIHLAIVSDEYGGFSGIVTLEDILEQIVGEIQDEFDEKEEFYKKEKENIYVFEGKTTLIDFSKILNLPEDFFEQYEEEVETIAGLILALKKGFPEQGEKFYYKNLEFIIEEMDERRIKKIKVLTKNN